MHAGTHAYSHKGELGAYLSPEKLLINNDSSGTLSDSHYSSPLQSSVFHSGITLPRSNFTDKTPRGRWVLTKVTHASATFKANHNSIFHLKGCFTNLLRFKCTLWAVFEVSPLKTVCICPLLVISDCERATTAAPMINMTRGVYYEMLSCQWHAALIMWVSQRAAERGSVCEITQIENIWFVFHVWINECNLY